MSRQIKVGITQGDINGVGYEVILGALADEAMTELCTPVVFGYHFLAEKCRRQLALEEMRFSRVQDAAHAQAGHINIVEVGPEVPEHNPGQPTEASGKAAVAALECAVNALKNKEIDVLVTAPISKEAVQGDSFHFPGHTEYLESVAGEGAKARMILFDDYVRVALVSTHLPMSEVAKAVTKESVGEAISSLADSLRRDFGFERPSIAVLSLNPHCGDGGLLGNEEKEHIEPAIAEAKAKGILAFGPYASDGFFGNGEYRKYDGIVAMYHDQGLAPFKTLAGEHGVNFTAGLPFVRTSPDHGTAFGIAWKGTADPTSMREAIYKALDIFRKRAIFDEAASNPLRKYVNEKPDKGERTEKQPRQNNQQKQADENGRQQKQADENGRQQKAADKENNGAVSAPEKENQETAES